MLQKLPKVEVNKNIVIKTAIVLVVLVGLVGLVSAVAAQWKVEQNKKQADTLALVQKQAEDRKKIAEADRVAALLPKYEAAYQKQRVECEKGRATYELLPTATRKTVKPENVPSCLPAKIKL